MKTGIRRVLIAAALLLPSLVLVSQVESAHSAAASTSFSITTNPPLTPSFDPAVFDYAVRCTTSTTTNLTTTGSDQTVVGGTTFTGPVNVNLALVAGQEVTVTYDGAAYYIRCLPSDFPSYSSAVTGTPQASNGYFVTIGGYAVIFNTQGVPVWWYHGTSTDAKFLSPTEVAWDNGANKDIEVRNLSGSLLQTDGGGSNPLDPHDFQLLPNGDYLAIMDVTRNCPAVPSQCVDLSSWGLSSQSTITDNVIVELNPSNQIVWSWSVADHIDVATANVNWRDWFPDVIHMNSIEYDGNGGIIFSARHLDAIYRIDMATGDLTWKLGGTAEPESLTVSGDQYLDAGGQLFSGQHDARLLPDGSLTVHDNGSRANRPPRALRFTIDTSTDTATEVEQVTDARVTAPSPFTGSVEKLPGGDWVADWGGGDFTTELSPAGVPQLTITYPGQASYREADVQATVSALRQGMDAMVAPLTNVPSVPAMAVPSSGATLSGSTYLDASATNATSVEFLLFGGNGYWGYVAGTATPTDYGWLYHWDTTTVPNGSYVLLAEALNAGGSALSSGVDVTVQNLPTTSVLIPSNGATLSGSTTLDASATNATSVEFLLFGGTYGYAAPVVCTATPTYYGWLCNWDTTTVPDGSYTLLSEAFNSAGSMFSSSGVRISVNN